MGPVLRGGMEVRDEIDRLVASLLRRGRNVLGGQLQACQCRLHFVQSRRVARGAGDSHTAHALAVTSCHHRGHTAYCGARRRALEFLVGAPGAGDRGGNVDRGNDLPRLKGGLEGAAEEFLRRPGMLALGAHRLDHCFQRKSDGGQVGRWVVISQAPADCSAISHLRVAKAGKTLNQGRVIFADRFGGEKLGVGHHRPDVQTAVFAAPELAQLGDLPQVHEQGGGHATAFEIKQQVMSACQGRGAGAHFEQLHSVGETLGGDVVELNRNQSPLPFPLSLTLPRQREGDQKARQHNWFGLIQRYCPYKDPTGAPETTARRSGSVMRLTHGAWCKSRQTFSAVTGISTSFTPRSDSASQTALTIAGGTAGLATSPAPLAPSGL